MKRINFKEHRGTITRDIVAGLTGATAGAPQSMGFALLGGVSPLYGLYASVIPTIVGGIFVNTRLMTVAPPNVLMLLVAGMLATYGDPVPPYPLFTFTLLIGLIQIGFGLLRLGNLTQYVSNAVTTGFISGAGVLIILGQLDLVTGYNVKTSSNALADFVTWIQRWPETNFHAVLVGLLTILIVFTLRRTRFKSFSVMIGIVSASVLPLGMGWDHVETVRTMSEIPSGLPFPELPDFSYIRGVFSIAFATSILASVQSAALAESIRASGEPQPDINKDLLAQGFSNLAGSFFQSLPASGSLSRTAINKSAGAVTRWSNIFAGVFIGLLLIGAGDLIELVALPALAGNLIIAAIGLINIKAIEMVWSVNWTARAAMIATFLSTLILPLDFSIYIGVALSLGLYLHTSTNRVEIVRMLPVGDGHFTEVELPETLPSSEPVILSIYGNLYFGSLRKLERMLPAADSMGCQAPLVILRMRHVFTIGSTGIKVLLRYDEQLRRCGGKLILAGVSDKLKAELERAHAFDQLEREAVFPPTTMVFEALENALAYAYSLQQQPANLANSASQEPVA
ncbi:MAG: SulP family inorganic anion transporter [Anaerolineae bacterium]|nr:SulP family inorganic anion transporter [Anaerolineae bacterium]